MQLLDVHIALKACDIVIESATIVASGIRFQEGKASAPLATYLFCLGKPGLGVGLHSLIHELFVGNLHRTQVRAARGAEVSSLDA
jgi:hypothetical protein